MRREGLVRAAEMAVVGEEDRVEADACEWRPLVLPGRRGGLEGVVERHPQRVVARLDEDLARAPVDSDGRLARRVLRRARRPCRRLEAAWGRRRRRHGDWTAVRRGMIHERWRTGRR